MGPVSDGAAADVDAAMDSLKLSIASTAGDADTSAAAIATAMADIGFAGDAAALSLDTTMASVDATMSLAAADTAIDAGDMAASMAAGAGSADTADTAFLGLSTGGLAIVAAAIIGTGAVLFDLGSKYQTATNQLAAGADISLAAANKIGNAFTNQAFSTTFSTQSTMEVHSAAACQLGSVAGKALTASQALAVIKSAQDLAGARRPQLERFLLLPSTRARAWSAPLTAP
jgi:hypothetical protein